MTRRTCCDDLAARLETGSSPLLRRPRLEQEVLPPEVSAAALDAALEALGRAAFLVGPGGQIAFANRVGALMLAQDRRAVAEALLAEGHDRGPFELTPLRAPGWPDYRLAVLREGGGPSGMRLAAARARWGLTPAQARVLEQVASGASNKEIACTLACAEVTVENHVTALLRRSQARSRVDLVARLLGA